MNLRSLKFIFLLMPFAIASLSASAADEASRQRQFVQALEAFDRARTPAEFREAGRLFESLSEPQYQNGAVQYNAGNAYLRAGELGRAIYHYRRAKPFRPRDPYLDANLRQALSLAPGRLPDPPQPWWRHVFFWSDWLSLPGKFRAASAAWIVGALFASLAVLWRVRAGIGLAAAGLFCAVLLSLEAGVAYVDVYRPSRGVVVAESTVARKGNGLNYEPAFEQPLKDGAEFTVLEDRGEWVFARFEGAGDAWLPARDILR